jgi:hypothetical protein
MKKELEVAHVMSQGYVHKQMNQWCFQGIDNNQFQKE